MTRRRLHVCPPRLKRRLMLVGGALLVASGLVGCVSRVTFDVRETEVLAEKQRWSWADPAEPTTAPAGANPAGLRGALVQSVERALIGRGYAKATDAPEFRVEVDLFVRLEVESREIASAVGFLPSFNHTPSYDYQTFEHEEAHYARVWLSLRITDAETGRLLWHGRLVGRYVDDFGPHVEDAVSRLLRGLPWAPVPAGPAPRDVSDPELAGLRGAAGAVSLCERSEREHAAPELRACHPNRGHP